MKKTSKMFQNIPKKFTASKSANSHIKNYPQILKEPFLPDLSLLFNPPSKIDLFIQKQICQKKMWTRKEIWEKFHSQKRLFFFIFLWSSCSCPLYINFHEWTAHNKWRWLNIELMKLKFIKDKKVLKKLFFERIISTLQEIPRASLCPNNVQ